MTAQKDYAEAGDKAAAGHGGMKCPCCKVAAGKRGSRRMRRRVERLRLREQVATDRGGDGGMK